MLDVRREGMLPIKVGYYPTPYRYRRQVKQAENDADRLIHAAHMAGDTKRLWAPLGWHDDEEDRDAWFDACFGMTEVELADATNAAIARIKSFRRTPWRWRQRREAIMAYIKLDAMACKAAGLETRWA